MPLNGTYGGPIKEFIVVVWPVKDLLNPWNEVVLPICHSNRAKEGHLLARHHNRDNPTSFYRIFFLSNYSLDERVFKNNLQSYLGIRMFSVLCIVMGSLPCRTLKRGELNRKMDLLRKIQTFLTQENKISDRRKGY